MRVRTSCVEIQYDPQSRELTVEGRPSGAGKLEGFGTFSGQCAEEKPVVTTQTPAVGLVMIFQPDSCPEDPYVSAPITHVIEP